MNPAVNDAQTFELARLQTMDALRSVAEGMRHAATVLDNFAGAVSRMHHGQGIPPLPQGYALSSPVLPQGGGPPRQVEEHAQPQKRKRQTKVKDPNAPKRPASSYLLFQNAVRQEIKKENPSLPNNELLALISQRWAGMSEKEKQIYDDAMKASKVRYAAEKAAYEAASKPANGVAPSPLTTEPKAAVKPEPVVTTSTSEESSEEESAGSSSSSEEEEPEPTPKKPKKHDSAKPKKSKA